MTRRLALLLCGVAGACDVATGLLLLAAPRLALTLMHAGDALSEPIWMRYLGAFVLAIGLLHACALLRQPRGGARLSHVMEATAQVRAVIAVFTGVSVALGGLSSAWLVVTVTDGTVSIAQYMALRAGAFGDER